MAEDNMLTASPIDLSMPAFIPSWCTLCYHDLKVVLGSKIIIADRLMLLSNTAPVVHDLAVGDQKTIGL